MRARRSRDRRTCDSVRGQSTTPWLPCVPEAAPAVAGPGAVVVEVGAAAAIVAEDDLHHHGNWTRYIDNTWLIHLPVATVAQCTVDYETDSTSARQFKDRHVGRTRDRLHQRDIVAAGSIPLGSLCCLAALTVIHVSGEDALSCFVDVCSNLASCDDVTLHTGSLHTSVNILG